MDELKRCPFCGMKPDASTWYDGSLECWNALIECPACDVEIYVIAASEEQARQRALYRWNRRAQ